MTLVNTLANACFGVMMQVMLYLVDWITFKRCVPLNQPTTANVLIIENSITPPSTNATAELPFICYIASQREVFPEILVM